MPNLTTGLPQRTGNAEKDYKELYEWAVSLTDEIKSILCNLDSGNVSEAASVEARNIDVSKAKIKDAQIKSITADKLTAGTIDAKVIDVVNLNADNIVTGTLNAGNVTVAGDDGVHSVKLDGEAMEFRERVNDKSLLRIALGLNDKGKYIFVVQNRDGTQGIYMDEDGKIFIDGTLRTGDKIISATSIKVGAEADAAIEFTKTSNYDNTAAKIYYNESQDALIIRANNIILDGKIVG